MNVPPTDAAPDSTFDAAADDRPDATPDDRTALDRVTIDDGRAVDRVEADSADGTIDAFDGDSGDAPDVVEEAVGCASDGDCAAAGRVCDLVTGRCVECVLDAQCAASRHCGAERRCLDDRCPAGATRCADLATALTCDERGAEEVSAPCASGETCRGDRCQPAACTPGASRCAAGGAVEEASANWLADVGFERKD